MGPRALSSILTATLLACAAAFGCARSAQSSTQVDAAWAIARAPSTTSETIATLTLTDRARRPVTGARLQLEAQMSHPGMAPVVVMLTEPAAGRYEAAVRFSMAGDWILVAGGELPDGSRFTSRHDVTGVTGPE